MIGRTGWFLVALWVLVDGERPGVAGPNESGPDAIAQLIAVSPNEGIQRLNNGGFEALLAFHGFDMADRLALAAIAANARDTWPIEQLQRRRIQTMLREGKKKEALAAAKALFLVSGIGSTPYCIQQLCECIEQTQGRAAMNRFKLQQLALAHSDSAVRKRQSAELGENVLEGIEIDVEIFADAIEELKDKSDYDAAYARGNLLLLSGRVAEAREAFEMAYRIAPRGELRYASEGLAKVIKAEDLSIGRMNQFILSLRPGK